MSMEHYSFPFGNRGCLWFLASSGVCCIATHPKIDIQWNEISENDFKKWNSFTVISFLKCFWNNIHIFSTYHPQIMFDDARWGLSTVLHGSCWSCWSRFVANTSGRQCFSKVERHVQQRRHRLPHIGKPSKHNRSCLYAPQIYNGRVPNFSRNP